MNAKTANTLIARTATMNFEDLHNLAAELNVDRSKRDYFQRTYSRLAGKPGARALLSSYRDVIGSAIVAHSHND